MTTKSAPAEQASSPAPLRFERYADLKARGIDYTPEHLARLYKASPPKFPRPIKLSQGGDRIVWLSTELDQWMLERATAGRVGGGE